jgi:hypothetical protein
MVIYSDLDVKMRAAAVEKLAGGQRPLSVRAVRPARGCS